MISVTRSRRMGLIPPLLEPQVKGLGKPAHHQEMSSVLDDLALADAVRTVVANPVSDADVDDGVGGSRPTLTATTHVPGHLIQGRRAFGCSPHACGGQPSGTPPAVSAAAGNARR
jgi:hypothetical protein